jgi:hypothetical protein
MMSLEREREMQKPGNVGKKEEIIYCNSNSIKIIIICLIDLYLFFLLL